MNFLSHRSGVIAAVAALFVVVVLGVGVFLLLRNTSEDRSEGVGTRPTVSPTVIPVESLTTDEIVDEPMMQTQVVDFSALDSSFQFSSVLPSEYKVEYISDLESVNVYDPTLGDPTTGTTTLDQSVLFVRQFNASTFLTLQTVDIYSTEELSVQGHDARRYDIEKKAAVADFPGQPQWRNDRHTVTDVRLSESSPTTFYVFAQRPGTSDVIYQQFLSGLNFATDLSAGEEFVSPLDRYAERPVVKPFGILITPQNSPVQPERFSGYHTGLDLEILPGEDDRDVLVAGMCTGPVLLRRTASGYGGVVIQSCDSGGQQYSVLYGHLDFSSVSVGVGETIQKGQQFAVLGAGATSETDGERKHLHLSVRRGISTELAGYVSQQARLSEWVNPAELLE